jgi:hypothetical protein
MFETLERVVAEGTVNNPLHEDRARWLRITYYGSITGELAMSALGGAATGLLVHGLFAGGDTKAYAVVIAASVSSTYLCDHMRRFCKEEMIHDLSRP